MAWLMSSGKCLVYSTCVNNSVIMLVVVVVPSKSLLTSMREYRTVLRQQAHEVAQEHLEGPQREEQEAAAQTQGQAQT